MNCLLIERAEMRLEILQQSYVDELELLQQESERITEEGSLFPLILALLSVTMSLAMTLVYREEMRILALFFFASTVLFGALALLVAQSYRTRYDAKIHNDIITSRISRSRTPVTLSISNYKWQVSSQVAEDYYNRAIDRFLYVDKKIKDVRDIKRRDLIIETAVLIIQPHFLQLTDQDKIELIVRNVLIRYTMATYLTQSCFSVL